MVEPQLIDRGGLLKSLIYKRETGPDGRFSIVIKDVRDIDTEHIGYGTSYDEVMNLLWHAGFELMPEKAQMKQGMMVRKTWLRPVSRLPHRGFAIKRMVYMTERLKGGTYAMSVKNTINDVAERIFYGASLDVVKRDAFKEGYEIVYSSGQVGGGKYRYWETIRLA